MRVGVGVNVTKRFHTRIHYSTAGVEGNAESYNVFNVRKCNILFALSVVGLEHINNENTAVAVLRALFFNYDPDTGLKRPDARNASYQVSCMPRAQEPCT